MTKEDIKKAFVICCGAQNCTGCPILDMGKRNEHGCKFNLFMSVFDIVAEKENEIERLKTTLGQCNTELNSALESLKSQCREIGELKAEVKQAQVDTINTIVEYCENPNHWNELKDCKLWGGKSDDLRVFLNGIFKEVENEQKG